MLNNPDETAIRPTISGRKNWFCDNRESAENAATIYSMPGCGKTHGVNFRDRLVYFLNYIHPYDDDYSKDLTELLLCNLNRKTRTSKISVSYDYKSSPNILEKLSSF